MFAQDRFAEQQVAAWFGFRNEEWWRLGVRRFRRSGPRIAAGFALIGRGVGDLFAGSPAVAAVGGTLLLVWLARNVALIRLGLRWLIAAHRGLIALFAAGARMLARVWRPLAFAILLIAVALVITPALDNLGALLAPLADALAARRIQLPTLPEPPPVDWSSFGATLGAFLGRALFVVALSGLAITGALALAVGLSYVVFTLYVTVRLFVLGAIAAARAVARFIRWLGAGALALVRAVARGIVWLAITFAHTVRAVVLGAIRAIAWTGRMLVALAVAVVRGLWRTAVWILRLLVGLAFLIARQVWTNVFRLFALTGTIAAVAVTAWAVQSMRQGRPLPDSLADLAASTVYAAAALLIALSTFAILAAIALAVRHAPPRLVRAVGLAALALLVLAPTPFLLRALWTSEPIAAARAATPELLATLAERAPPAIAAALGVLVLALTAAIVVAQARKLTRRAWVQLAAAAIVVAAGVALVVAVDRFPTDAAVQNPTAAAGPLLAVLLAILAFAALCAALWLLARTPERVRRAAALGLIGIAALAALGYGGVFAWRRADPPAALADLGESWGERWEAWRQARPERRIAPEIIVPEPSPVPVPETPHETPAPVDPAPPATDLPSVDLEGALVALEARRVFPVSRELHWRFGDASLVGDGLTAFAPLSAAAADLELCAARTVVAVGMASGEGPPAVNESLAQCRAARLAALAQAAVDACPDAAAIRVLALSLGAAPTAVDDPADRRALIVALDGELPADASLAELDATLAGRKGAVRIAAADADAPICATE